MAAPVLRDVRPVGLPLATVPVTTGAVVSSVKLSEPMLVLPAGSVCVATTVCWPSRRPVGVNDQLPLASAVAVAATGVPSIVKLTTALGAAVPVSAAFDVILSVAEAPVSTASFGVTVPATVSSVKVSEVEPMLPATSVWLATTVCWPSASPVGVNDQLPLASAVAVVLVALPSTVNFTVEFAAAVPEIVAFDVILSVADAPVSLASFDVTVGAAVSSVKLTLAEPVPPVFVSLATMLCWPSLRPVGVKDRLPLASAVAVAVAAAPSTANFTVAFGSAVPLSVATDVIWSLAEAPVSLDKAAVTVGAAGTGVVVDAV